MKQETVDFNLAPPGLMSIVMAAYCRAVEHYFGEGLPEALMDEIQRALVGAMRAAIKDGTGTDLAQLVEDVVAGFKARAGRTRN